jgi:predicted phage terminase large subunit-like protein
VPIEQLRELELNIGPKRVLALAVTEKLALAQRRTFAAPGGFIKFVRYFWDVLEPDTPFVDGWVIQAIALHLEAVAFGEMNRLLVNVPPGSAKSLLSSVFFPLWVWAALERPGARFLCVSYAAALPERDNRRMLNLALSPRFQQLYGKAFKLTKMGEELIENDKTGFKQAAGIGGTVTGRRGDFLIYDDPNNVADIESDVMREGAARNFLETASNRLNDMVNSAIIVIQQRSHQNDVSGTILEGGLPYVHLCVPALHELLRACSTYLEDELFWEDPRTEEGECYWPEKMPPEAIQTAMDMGDFAFAGQYQQRPEPRGGGILKREYWKDWDPEPNPRTGRREYPVCDFVVASLDPAFTAKDKNDPSGFTIWGAFQTKKGERGAILIDAFAKRLELAGPPIERHPGETDMDFRARTEGEWGLIETVYDRCKRYKVNVLLVENKGSGLSVIQAMEKLFIRRNFQIQAVDTRGLNKEARVNTVQPEFAGGYIYAPLTKDFAKMVMNQCAVFPRGSHDDLVDSTTQAIYFLRSNGFLERREEQFLSREDAMKKYKQPQPVYQI